MQPPDIESLPAVARAGAAPVPGREALQPREPLLNACTVVMGVVFLADALLIGLAGGADHFVAAALGGVVSWLILAFRTRAESEALNRPAAETRAAMAIPQEEIDRVVMYELGTRPENAGTRWQGFIEAHRREGRYYEAWFWVRVTDRAHRILLGRPSRLLPGEASPPRSRQDPG